MMKHLSIYLILLVFSALSLASTSCRTNNGDIGYLYGEWVMTGLVLTDGTIGETPDNYLRFQNDIVEITVVSDNHDSLVTFGRWTRDGDILTLDFSGNLDADGNMSPNTPLGWLGLTGQTVMRCEILKETRRNLVLKITPPDRDPITYLFDKVL